jgi:hypothetical protein
MLVAVYNANMQPYTYLVGWTQHKIFYYGSRYGKGCHPSDLWKKYFTSSKEVAKKRLELGEPDLVQVRRTFETPQQAMFWEKRVLRRMKTHRREDFLNITQGNMPTTAGFKYSDESRGKMGAWQRGKKKPAEAVAKMKASLTGRKDTDEARKNKSIGHTGLVFAEEHRANIAKTKVGRKFWMKDGKCVCTHEWPGEGWVPGKAHSKKKQT